MPRITCTVCKTAFDPAESAALPFCSERCRRIDLGRWLDERYTVPKEEPDAEVADGDDHP